MTGRLMYKCLFCLEKLALCHPAESCILLPLMYIPARRQAVLSPSSDLRKPLLPLDLGPVFAEQALDQLAQTGPLI